MRTTTHRFNREYSRFWQRGSSITHFDPVEVAMLTDRVLIHQGKAQPLWYANL